MILELKEDLKDELILIRRHLHQFPELSFKEVETSSYVCEVLNHYDIPYETFGTGVVATIHGKKPGKTLAIRADLDALPIQEETGLPYRSQHKGVMHACGHDIHATVVLGSAIVLQGLREQVSGTIKFLFQPAEEVLEGAKSLIAAGVLRNPEVDALMGVHTWPDLPVGTVGLKRGAMTAASDFITIEVKGKSGHAAHPEDAVDPIVIAGHLLSALQTIVSRELSPLRPAVLTIGRINGGQAPNSIPEQVELSGMIRSLDEESRAKIIRSTKRICEHTAKTFNGRASVEVKQATPTVSNDPGMTEHFFDCATRILGKERVVRLEEPSLGSEDFAYYLAEKPGVFFRLGTNVEHNKNTKQSLHSSRIEFGEEAIFTGVQVISSFALSFGNEKHEKPERL
ncbi:M20 family metallopeptidase [Geomicrobium sp. JCM 19055]|uniref:M20 metallopeptidase family protein n=1 Tax=Geomicrobium sp. JCM 19055 TaxID=1460649 RepID=UPI00045EDD9D|nr:M20 family metallopeptidase [Geomicrobium sp. JCM 19055]GAJ98355.1 p-aminobenzoyl-glutamate hydrolase subunit A [Geomicrobium sp. JCM 19055]